MDITSALFDPKLGSTAFTVERITYTRGRGGITSRSTTARALGCIHPETPEMLKLLPEEERNDTFIVICTDYPLSTSTPEASGAPVSSGPDRIHWKGETWRVVRVRDWQSFGNVQAPAELIRE